MKINIRNGSLIVGFLIFTLGVSSCGKRSDDTDVLQAAENTAKEIQLMGTWESECGGAKLLGAPNKHYYNFTGDTFVDAYDLYFGQTDCQDSSAMLSYEGSFKLGEVIEKNDARKIDFEYKNRVFLKPFTEAGANHLNSISFCGITDWKQNVAKDLTHKGGIVCGLLHNTIPETKKNIIKIEDDQLFFGASYGIELTKQRPESLDMKNAYKKSNRTLTY